MLPPLLTLSSISTPFYAEMGGQLADHGTIRLPGGDTVIDVTDVQAPIRGLTVHRGHLAPGWHCSG